ncbi:unnamed protein product, partial [Ectocarpus fasciculatus]
MKRHATGRSTVGLVVAVCCAPSLLQSIDGQYTEYDLCTENLATVEDGVCDSSNNIASCLYDGGDCCPSTCVSTAGLCTEDTRQCLNPSASDYPYAEYGNCTAILGNLPYIGDGICDEVNNNAECGYDGGDCCPSTCDVSSTNYCPEDNSECVNPFADDFGYPGFENCTGYPPSMGNGLCIPDNNNAECGYDGGDCCECSCQPGQFMCLGRFDCLDPAYNTTECVMNTTACDPDLSSREWLVEDTADAIELANAIDCTGGMFDVEWRGSVIVPQTLWISEGTTVNITGVDTTASPAVVDGNGESRIFGVINASLNLHGMTLSNGHGVVGGAIFSALGTVTLSGGSALVNNSADEHGGAMFVDGGTVSWDGDMMIADNSCSWDGGAILIRSAASVSWSGNTTFIGNRIYSFGHNGGFSYGGAINVADESKVSWTEQTRFIDNRIDVDVVDREVVCYGGAVAVDGNSSAIWSGSTTFEDNEACFCGGALHANDSAVFSWTGETVFSNNKAASGGVVCLEWKSSASWSNSTAFVGNNASDDGGALYVTDTSSVVWTGDTRFEGNSALNGGAVHVSATFSSIAWSGETTFEGNFASGSGGGLFVGEGAEVYLTGRTDFSNNHADVNGGAVVSALNSDTDATESVIAIGGITTFFNNSCQ